MRRDAANSPQDDSRARRTELVIDPEADESIDFRQYLHVLLYRKWLIAVTTLGFLLLGALQLRNSDPVYSSTATIRYDPVGLQIVNFTEIEGRTKLTEEIRTQIEVIRSPRLARRVIDSLGLYGSGAPVPTAEPGAASPLARLKSGIGGAWEAVRSRLVTFEPEAIDPEVATRQRQEEHLRAHIEVSQIRDTKLIEIAVFDTNQSRAARIADEFCNQFILSLLEDKTNTYRLASKWFEDQLTEKRGRLLDAERALFEYQGQSDIRVLQQNYEIANDTMKNLTLALEETRNEIARYEAESKAADDTGLLAALLEEDAVYTAVNARLNELRLQRFTLVAENTVRHPSVRKIDREIEVLTAQQGEMATKLKAEVSAREQIARFRLASLEERLSEQETSMQAMQKDLIEFRAYQREVDSTQQIFTSLLDQSKKIDVSADLDPSNVTLMSRAPIPEFASSPKVMRTLMLFSLFGFSLGVGMVLLIHKLDRSIKDPKMVEARLGLPTLGMIPHLKLPGKLFARRRAGHSPLLSDFDPKSTEAESFRVLRTALQYSSAGRPPQVILVSSCFPQEGKSTVAVNMAISYSQRGGKVLLVDADLKMPVAHKSFHKDRMPGLSDVIAGQKKLDDVIVPTGVENLDLIPAGHATPSPADLLESDAMAATVEALRGRYAMVIVDSAPLTGMADTLVLTKISDGICIVVNRGKTPFDALGKVVSTLDGLQAHILGVIYNSRARTEIGRAHV